MDQKESLFDSSSVFLSSCAHTTILQEVPYLRFLWSCSRVWTLLRFFFFFCGEGGNHGSYIMLPSAIIEDNSSVCCCFSRLTRLTSPLLLFQDWGMFLLALSLTIGGCCVAHLNFNVCPLRLYIKSPSSGADPGGLCLWKQACFVVILPLPAFSPISN